MVYERSLVNSKDTLGPLLACLLLLLTPLKRSRRSMVSAEVIEILDLVNADDPVFAGESLLEAVENGALVWQPGASDAVHGLTRREQGVVVVIRQLVPVGMH